MSVAEMAPPRLRWWEGVGSPGIVGYVLADVAAVGALALILPLTALLTGDVAEYALGVFMVGFYALFLSIPLALVGIPIVHLSCRRVSSQAAHVLAAGFVGLGLITLLVLVTSGDLTGFGLYLGAATAIGRAAVIPLARGRRRS